MSPSTPKFAVVVLILALVVSMMLSMRIAQRRVVCVAHGPQNIVRAGFNKFLSHIAWMRLIQYRGSLHGITEQEARVLKGKYDSLTDLDPMFDRAYEEGALEIGWQSPNDSLDLLDKAQRVDKLKSWRIPLLAGFIAKNRLNDSSRAIAYLKKADQQPNRPGYVKRFLISLQAQHDFDNDPIKVLHLWVDYYSGGAGQLLTGHGRMPMRDMESGFDSDPERSLALNHIRRVSTKIIEQSQKGILEERNPERKKMLRDRIDQTEKIIRQVYAGRHICPQCFRPYNAGEEFCVHDGKKLAAYGTCAKCKSVPRGPFCQKCGAKND